MRRASCKRNHSLPSPSPGLREHPGQFLPRRSPPKRDRLLASQAQQDFPILPNPEDPDCGNLYRNLKFPDAIYDHLSQYQEQKANAE